MSTEQRQTSDKDFFNEIKADAYNIPKIMGAMMHLGVLTKYDLLLFESSEGDMLTPEFIKMIEEEGNILMDTKDTIVIDNVNSATVFTAYTLALEMVDDDTLNKHIKIAPLSKDIVDVVISR